MRILVVEDDEKTGAFIAKAVRAEGFADVLRSGNPGLAAVEATPFDAVVLDLMLIGRDGLSAPHPPVGEPYRLSGQREGASIGLGHRPSIQSAARDEHLELDRREGKPGRDLTAQPPQYCDILGGRRHVEVEVERTCAIAFG